MSRVRVSVAVVCLLVGSLLLSDAVVGGRRLLCRTPEVEEVVVSALMLLGSGAVAVPVIVARGRVLLVDRPVFDGTAALLVPLSVVEQSPALVVEGLDVEGRVVIQMLVLVGVAGNTLKKDFEVVR